MKTSTPLTAVVLSALFYFNACIAAGGLPQKAFDLDDGFVAVAAGVMPGPAATSALPIGKMKYPTRYFVELRNESPYPVWFDATWTFPEKNKTVKSKTIQSKKVPTGASYIFFSDKFGVIAGQAILVDLQAWSEEKRVNRVGAQQAELLFEQKDVDAFLASFPSAFKGRSGDVQQVGLISGWRDLPPLRTDVPGTVADATLQTDIQQLLWKFDSRKRWSCEREIVGAMPIDVGDSDMLASHPAETRQQAALEQFSDTLNVERWTIKSCGQEFVYEVMMSASPAGGTDIAAVELSGGQSSQIQPEVAVVE